MKYNYKYWIKKLRLKKHPEGGFFRENLRDSENLLNKYLPKRYGNIGIHSFYTCIYYLINGRSFSTFHKLKSDEIWIFLNGNPITIYIITNNNKLNKIKLGNNIDKKEKLIYRIIKGSWFAASLDNKNDKSFTLVNCLVIPGFEYSDFLSGNRQLLLKRYKKYSKVILEHTKG